MIESGLARIIPLFPVVERRCFDCDHGYLGVDGVYCRVLNDVVGDEKEAETCDFFED